MGSVQNIGQVGYLHSTVTNTQTLHKYWSVNCRTIRMTHKNCLAGLEALQQVPCWGAGE
jgi:hypothetical protein